MELDIRGTPLFTMQGYLVGLGGVEQTDGSYAGEGWSVTLEELEWRYSHIVVPRVIIRFDGEPGAVAAVAGKLRLRATRVGG